MGKMGKLLCVKTREDVKPVFISQGYKTDLETAIDVILKCTTCYKLPEPLRCANMLANLKRKN